MQPETQTSLNDLPKDFKAQPIGVKFGKVLADLAANEIARFFREHPEAAEEILFESKDERFEPTTFVCGDDGVFRVGWFSSRAGRECVRTFTNLSDAATDYL